MRREASRNAINETFEQATPTQKVICDMHTVKPVNEQKCESLLLQAGNSRGKPGKLA